MKKAYSIYQAFFALAVVATAIVATAFPEVLNGFISLLSVGSSMYMLGTVTAPGVPAGTVSYEDTLAEGDDYYEQHVSKIVTEVKPDQFPLDTLLRKIRKSETASNVKVEYDTVVYLGRQSATAALFTAAGSDADKSVVLTVTTADIWTVYDTVYIPTILGADSKPLRLYVMAVDRAADTITVTAINGSGADGQRVPTIASATVIYRSAPAISETKSFWQTTTQLPARDYNYCQIMGTTIERSVVDAKLRAKSGHSFNDKVNEKIYGLRSSMEAAYLFGSRKRTLNSVDGEYVHTMNGITNIITQSIDYGTGAGATDMSIADVLDMQELAFAGKNGSDKRFMLCGKKVVTAMSKLTFDRQVESMGKMVMHGIKVEGLSSGFGEVYYKYSALLDNMGWENKAIVLDLDNVIKSDLETMHTTKLNPDQAGTRRVQDSIRILENSTVTLRNIGTHLVWQPTA
jgi:hypothetical protein